MTDVYEVVARSIGPATVRPPGSKSITNRALIAASLSPGRSTIKAALLSDDTEAMVGCLSAMGVDVRVEGTTIHVRSTGYLTAGGPMDARASGTTARFITAAATLAAGPSVVDGSERMRQRPIGHLIDGLVALGAGASATDGFPPVNIDGGGMLGGRAAIDASASSQFVSAIMLAAPRASQPVILELGNTVVSRPYLTTTIEVMEAFGAHAAWSDESTIRVESTGYRPADFLVEADASAAVYPWSAAAITGSLVTVAGIDPSSTQSDMEVLRVLELMGCDVTWNPAGIEVRGPSQLRGVHVDMNACPDGSVAVAVLAAFASSPSELYNIANLRIKETDRLGALEVELTKLGATVTTGPDWIRIEPNGTNPAQIATYDDHRIAMAFAVAGLVQPGVVIEDPACVAKTWPTFFEMLESL